MKKLGTLNEALTYQLEDMYDAEKKIQKFLPRLAKKLTSKELKKEITGYLETSRDKRTKLKRVFSYLLTGPFNRKNAVIDEMLAETNAALRLSAHSFLRDSLVIANIQNINNYKVAAYGTAKAFAEQLGLQTAVDLLDEMLVWEKDTNRALSRIAVRHVNVRAAQAPPSPHLL